MLAKHWKMSRGRLDNAVESDKHWIQKTHPLLQLSINEIAVNCTVHLLNHEQLS